MAPTALIAAIAAHAHAIYLLPLLLTPPPPADSTSAACQQHYQALVALLMTLGFRRNAPGLFSHAQARDPPLLKRIIAGLPQADVLGLGPAARSRVNESRFDNYVAFADYARDLGHGGFGIARTYTTTPVAQFIEELTLQLAGGDVADLHALALRCHCASASFTEHCDAVIGALVADGAITRTSAHRIALSAPNDARFATVHTTLARLREQAPLASLHAVL